MSSKHGASIYKALPCHLFLINFHILGHVRLLIKPRLHLRILLILLEIIQKPFYLMMISFALKITALLVISY